MNGDGVNGSNPNILALKDRTSRFKVEQRSDEVVWRWSSNESFTVKSIYAALSNGVTRDARASKIWSLEIFLKVKIFTWLVLKKRHFTADNLLKRGWTGTISCVLRKLEEETVNHLFVKCVFSKFLVTTALEGSNR
uniref:Reverse transcriptase zinc-binding domain-containing protein n=1 Tax=Ananas comosus var. bracteatus TaxID=296719 RepID=A0A6V7PCE2_ANACO|nr:unnamed protein product [Ananas comosus var. bracteatus]